MTGVVSCTFHLKKWRERERERERERVELHGQRYVSRVYALVGLGSAVGSASVS